MGMYRKEWSCCNSATETDAWEPQDCPFCAPQPQRTWVRLTDEEIDYYIVHRFGVATKKNLVELIRLCEAKSKEKNHG